MPEYSSASRPALFIDRDGTIIEDRGFLTKPEEVVFIPEAITALQRLQEHYLLFIVTHQAGVARGLQTLEQVEHVNQFVVDELSRAGVVITDLYCCPHDRSEGCRCIKPNPFFLHEAEREHGADLSNCYSIGDHLADVQLAESVDGVGIFVLTGHGEKHRHEVPKNTPLFDHLGDAADWILSRTNGA